MNIEGFRKWMESKGTDRRVKSNNISRAKRIERELGVDLDREYQRDKCEYLLKCFEKHGDNENMKKYKTSLPVGKDSMDPYACAIRKYVSYKKKL